MSPNHNFPGYKIKILKLPASKFKYGNNRVAVLKCWNNWVMERNVSEALPMLEFPKIIILRVANQKTLKQLFKR